MGTAGWNTARAADFNDPTGLPNRLCPHATEKRGRRATEDFKSCSRQTPSVTMGHISRECGRLSGGSLGIVTHENRYSPIEQAQVRPKLELH
jgi:hypothetical protein